MSLGPSNSAAWLSAAGMSNSGNSNPYEHMASAAVHTVQGILWKKSPSYYKNVEKNEHTTPHKSAVETALPATAKEARTIAIAEIELVAYRPEKKDGRRFDVTLKGGRVLALMASSQNIAIEWIMLLRTKLDEHRAFVARAASKVQSATAAAASNSGVFAHGHTFTGSSAVAQQPPSALTSASFWVPPPPPPINSGATAAIPPFQRSASFAGRAMSPPPALPPVITRVNSPPPNLSAGAKVPPPPPPVQSLTISTTHTVSVNSTGGNSPPKKKETGSINALRSPKKGAILNARTGTAEPVSHHAPARGPLKSGVPAATASAVPNSHIASGHAITLLPLTPNREHRRSLSDVSSFDALSKALLQFPSPPQTPPHTEQVAVRALSPPNVPGASGKNSPPQALGGLTVLPALLHKSGSSRAIRNPPSPKASLAVKTAKDGSASGAATPPSRPSLIARRANAAAAASASGAAGANGNVFVFEQTTQTTTTTSTGSSVTTQTTTTTTMATGSSPHNREGRTRAGSKKTLRDIEHQIKLKKFAATKNRRRCSSLDNAACAEASKGATGSGSHKNRRSVMTPLQSAFFADCEREELRSVLKEFTTDWLILMFVARYITRSYLKRMAEGPPKSTDKQRMNTLLLRAKEKEREKSKAGRGKLSISGPGAASAAAAAAASVNASPQLSITGTHAGGSSTPPGGTLRSTIIAIPQGALKEVSPAKQMIIEVLHSENVERILVDTILDVSPDDAEKNKDNWCLSWKVLFLYLRWKALHSTLVLKGALTDEEAVDIGDEQFATALTRLVVPLTSSALLTQNPSASARIGSGSRFTSELRETLFSLLLRKTDEIIDWEVADPTANQKMDENGVPILPNPGSGSARRPQHGHTFFVMGKKVVHAGLWSALLMSLKYSSLVTRRMALEDVNAVLLGSNVNIDCLRRRAGWQYLLLPLLVDIALPAVSFTERVRQSIIGGGGGGDSGRRSSLMMRGTDAEERKKEYDKLNKQVYAFVMHVFALVHINVFSKSDGFDDELMSSFASLANYAGHNHKTQEVARMMLLSLLKSLTGTEYTSGSNSGRASSASTATGADSAAIAGSLMDGTKASPRGGAGSAATLESMQSTANELAFGTGYSNCPTAYINVYALSTVVKRFMFESPWWASSPSALTEEFPFPDAAAVARAGSPDLASQPIGGSVAAAGSSRRRDSKGNVVNNPNATTAAPKFSLSVATQQLAKEMAAEAAADADAAADVKSGAFATAWQPAPDFVIDAVATSPHMPKHRRHRSRQIPTNVALAAAAAIGSAGSSKAPLSPTSAAALAAKIKAGGSANQPVLNVERYKGIRFSMTTSNTAAPAPAVPTMTLPVAGTGATAVTANTTLPVVMPSKGQPHIPVLRGVATSPPPTADRNTRETYESPSGASSPPQSPPTASPAAGGSASPAGVASMGLHWTAGWTTAGHRTRFCSDGILVHQILALFRALRLQHVVTSSMMPNMSAAEKQYRTVMLEEYNFWMDTTKLLRYLHDPSKAMCEAATAHILSEFLRAKSSKERQRSCPGSDAIWNEKEAVATAVELTPAQVAKIKEEQAKQRAKEKAQRERDQIRRRKQQVSSGGAGSVPPLVNMGSSGNLLGTPRQQLPSTAEKSPVSPAVAAMIVTGGASPRQPASPIVPPPQMPVVPTFAPIPIAGAKSIPPPPPGPPPASAIAAAAAKAAAASSPAVLAANAAVPRTPPPPPPTVGGALAASVKSPPSAGVTPPHIPMLNLSPALLQPSSAGFGPQTPSPSSSSANSTSSMMSTTSSNQSSARLLQSPPGTPGPFSPGAAATFGMSTPTSAPHRGVPDKTPPPVPPLPRAGSISSPGGLPPKYVAAASTPPLYRKMSGSLKDNGPPGSSGGSGSGRIEAPGSGSGVKSGSASARNSGTGTGVGGGLPGLTLNPMESSGGAGGSGAASAANSGRMAGLPPSGGMNSGRLTELATTATNVHTSSMADERIEHSHMESSRRYSSGSQSSSTSSISSTLGPSPPSTPRGPIPAHHHHLPQAIAATATTTATAAVTGSPSTSTPTPVPHGRTESIVIIHRPPLKVPPPLPATPPTPNRASVSSTPTGSPVKAQSFSGGKGVSLLPAGVPTAPSSAQNQTRQSLLLAALGNLPPTPPTPTSTSASAAAAAGSAAKK